MYNLKMEFDPVGNVFFVISGTFGFYMKQSTRLKSVNGYNGVLNN